MKSILVINESRCPPQDLDTLRALGYTILWTEGADVPSVQLVPSKEDHRFTAACAALSGVLAGRRTPIYEDGDVYLIAMGSVRVADALLLELDQTAKE